MPIFEVNATINLADGSEVDEAIAAASLEMIWQQILYDHPTVTSVVLVFSTPQPDDPSPPIKPTL